MQERDKLPSGIAPELPTNVVTIAALAAAAAAVNAGAGVGSLARNLLGTDEIVIGVVDANFTEEVYTIKVKVRNQGDHGAYIEQIGAEQPLRIRDVTIAKRPPGLGFNDFGQSSQPMVEPAYVPPGGEQDFTINSLPPSANVTCGYLLFSCSRLNAKDTEELKVRVLFRHPKP